MKALMPECSGGLGLLDFCNIIKDPLSFIICIMLHTASPWYSWMLRTAVSVQVGPVLAIKKVLCLHSQSAHDRQHRSERHLPSVLRYGCGRLWTWAAQWGSHRS